MMNEKRVDILVYTNWMAPRTAQLDELRICTRKCRPLSVCLYSFVPCFAAQRPNQENWRKCGAAATAADKNYSKDDQRREEKKPRTWGGGRRHEEGGRGRGRHRHSCPPCLAIGNRHTTAPRGQKLTALCYEWTNEHRGLWLRKLHYIQQNTDTHCEGTTTLELGVFTNRSIKHENENEKKKNREKDWWKVEKVKPKKPSPHKTQVLANEN